MNTSFQSPVLTERVNFTWEEMQLAAKGIMPASAVPVAHQSPLNSSPVPERLAVPGAMFGTLPPQTASVGEDAFAVPEGAVNDLADQLSAVLCERIHSQLGVIVDMAMKNAGVRIRADLDRAIEQTVAVTVAQHLRNK